MHNSEYGYAEGEVCKRDGCAGHIDSHKPDNCSCHISPPCSACTAPRNFCPVCDWQEEDEPMPEPPPPTKAQQDEWAAWREANKPRTLADLDGTKIDWIHVPCGSTCSMIKEGVFPAGVTTEELRKKIDGTFGGRFEYLIPPQDGRPGKFKFTAYTD